MSGLIPSSPGFGQLGGKQQTVVVERGCSSGEWKRATADVVDRLLTFQTRKPVRAAPAAACKTFGSCIPARARHPPCSERSRARRTVGRGTRTSSLQQLGSAPSRDRDGGRSASSVVLDPPPADPPHDHCGCWIALGCLRPWKSSECDGPRPEASQSFDALCETCGSQQAVRIITFQRPRPMCWHCCSVLRVARHPKFEPWCRVFTANGLRPLRLRMLRSLRDECGMRPRREAFSAGRQRSSEARACLLRMLDFNFEKGSNTPGRDFERGKWVSSHSRHPL